MFFCCNEGSGEGLTRLGSTHQQHVCPELPTRKDEVNYYESYVDHGGGNGDGDWG